MWLFKIMVIIFFIVCSSFVGLCYLLVFMESVIDGFIILLLYVS